MSIPASISRWAKSTWLGRHVISPIRSPVHRHDGDVAGPFHGDQRPADRAALRSDRSGTRATPGRSTPAAQRRGMPLDSMPQEATRPAFIDSGKTAGHSAVQHRVLRRGHECRPRTTRWSVSASPWVTEIEHVVIRQRAGVGSDRGQTPDVVRMHPIVTACRGIELTVGGNCRFQIDQPDIGCEPSSISSASPHGHANSVGAALAVGLFGERHIDTGVRDNRFPQLRVTPVRQYLIDSATGHHVATEKDQRAESTTFHQGYCAPTA